MKLTFTLTLKADYHIGAGHGLGSQVDSALLRDKDGVPVLRGSTIEGLLRDGLWRLLQTPLLAARRKCQASGLANDKAPAYCLTDPCPLCSIFGTSAAPKRWRISSARPVGAEKPLSKSARWTSGQTGVQVAARVRVSPRMRRAEARKLFKQEEGNKRLAFTFTVTSLAEDQTTHAQAALLAATARMVRRFGSARRRGRGECSLSVASVEGWHETLRQGSTWQDHLLQHFRKAWIEGQPLQIHVTSPTWTTPSPATTSVKRYRLIVRVDEPIVVARRAEAGNIFEGNDAISGSTLLGALAQEAAARWNLSDQTLYQSFINIFRRGDVRFLPLYPTYVMETMIFPAIPAPLDLLVCKVHKRLDPHHSDPKSFARETTIPPECSVCECNIPLVPLGHYLAVREGAALVKTLQREEMHPRINPRTQRVATGNLFGYVGLETGQYFMGEIWCKDDHAWQLLCQLTGVLKEREPFPLRLGKATRRGYGLVTAWLEPIAGVDPWRGRPIEERVTNLSDPITLTLLTDAIIPDAWGRFRQSFDKELIEEVLGTPVEIIKIFCKAGFVDGFNNHLGLPRWRDVALKAGSVVGLRLKDATDLTALQDRMKKVENEGIGLRRHEGYGQVAFNHPVYQGGAGVPETGMFIPEPLKVALNIDAGVAKQIKSDFDFMRNWIRDLRDPRTFRESYFNKENWEAVARWLHTAAHLPVDGLISELDRFGKAEILTTVPREEKEHFTKQEAKQAMEHLQGWLRKTKGLSDPLRKLAIQLLANRVAASVERKGR
jgi:CRISPR-associated protein Csx10